MKKFFTCCFAVALGASVYAEEIKVLSVGPTIYDSLYCQLYGEAISADGRYVCGSVNFGVGLFVADALTGEVKYQNPDMETEGCELRGVSNTGLATGFTMYGVTYSFGDDKIVDLNGPEKTNVLGESVTNNGEILVGSILSNGTHAAYSKNGGEWTRLPLPPVEDILKLYPSVPGSSAAKKVSGDGKVILGFIGNFGVPCLWTLNDNGEYEADLFPLRYLNLNLTNDDVKDENKPLSGVSAHFLHLSNNGRYVALRGYIPKIENYYTDVLLVYDTQEKSLKVYPEVQDIDDAGLSLYPLAISDDGTFVGTVGQPNFESIGSFIMKAGQTQAETFVDAFPKFDDRYGPSDYYGFNVPTGISADGRYILCYTYYSDDYDDLDVPAYMESYIIDRGEDAAVGQVSVDNNATAIYSIDGRSLRKMAKGINIIRSSDGSVRKVMVK
ncbi:MAG: hypothetical protein K2L17_13745 [Muribaculaceae bacterium]|nr:hypothetical protein [Muribaculaceae bacterium]